MLGKFHRNQPAESPQMVGDLRIRELAPQKKAFAFEHLRLL